MFRNGPEYEARSISLLQAAILFSYPSLNRLQTDFKPPEITIKEIHDAIPKNILRRQQALSAYYILKDIALALSFYKAATYIPVASQYLSRSLQLNEWIVASMTWSLWSVYWWFQGLVWAGIFCLGMIDHLILKLNESLLSKVTT